MFARTESLVWPASLYESVSAENKMGLISMRYPNPGILCAHAMNLEGDLGAQRAWSDWSARGPVEHEYVFTVDDGGGAWLSSTLLCFLARPLYFINVAFRNEEL